MKTLLEQELGLTRENNIRYRDFEEAGLSGEAKKRLFNFIPPGLLRETVRSSINRVILGHKKKKNICTAVHEHRDSFIHIHACPNASHACFHGETTFIPGVLVGAFLIQELTGSLPMEHPGILYEKMIGCDQRAQKLYGISSISERLVTDRMDSMQYRKQCEEISPEIRGFQEDLYEKEIVPYVENFIQIIQDVLRCT